MNQTALATPTRHPSSALLKRSIRDALEHLKAHDIIEIDVRGKSGVTDTMVIASGTSTRHVSSIAAEVQRRARAIGNPPIGVEGEREGEWVLVDLGDAIVHVMLPRVRDLYTLERLWGEGGRHERPHTGDGIASFTA
ncbi:MAG TPA: ribosome silencing factor [Chiayiivirga sp.]|nr:ribosome silencing factor [Chiayiivirga sp.]